MSGTLQKWIAVSTIILGMGAHWVLLQSVAWTGMMISYSQQGSLREAIEKTFDGKHPCSLCKVVAAGQKTERTQRHQVLPLKLDVYAHLSPARLLYPLSIEADSVLMFDLHSPPGQPPLIPPPRVA